MPNRFKCKCEKRQTAVEKSFNNAKLLAIINNEEVENGEEVVINAWCLTMPVILDLWCEKDINEWGNTYYFLNSRDKFLNSNYGEQYRDQNLGQFLDAFSRVLWRHLPGDCREEFEQIYNQCESESPGPSDEGHLKLTRTFLEFLTREDE